MSGAELMSDGPMMACSPSGPLCSQTCNLNAICFCDVYSSVSCHWTLSHTGLFSKSSSHGLATSENTPCLWLSRVEEGFPSGSKLSIAGVLGMQVP